VAHGIPEGWLEETSLASLEKPGKSSISGREEAGWAVEN